MSNNDKNIVLKIKKGHLKTFEKLYKYYYTSLCKYALLIVKQDDVAEDIVQEVFLNIWKNRRNFELKKSLKSYLFRAVHNNALKSIQSKSIENKYSDYMLHTQAHEEANIEDFDISEQIFRSIEELPPKCKEVFMLSRFEKMKHAEIAEQLNISVKTVEVHIHRATLHLRSRLQEYKNKK